MKLGRTCQMKYWLLQLISERDQSARRFKCKVSGQLFHAKAVHTLVSINQMNQPVTELRNPNLATFEITGPMRNGRAAATIEADPLARTVHDSSGEFGDLLPGCTGRVLLANYQWEVVNSTRPRKRHWLDHRRQRQSR